MLMFSWQLVLIFLLAGRIYTMCQNENCNLLTVYSDNKQSLISIIGNQSALLVGSAETTNRSIKKIAGEHLLKKMVKDTSFYLLKDSSIQSLRLKHGLIA
ncbi:MAG: hypothetical protein IPP71_14445 [Bacteroidetes bacterium]|nr:hypothetical protein [Bacteroidota bacterium]